MVLAIVLPDRTIKKNTHTQTTVNQENLKPDCA